MLTKTSEPLPSRTGADVSQPNPVLNYREAANEQLSINTIRTLAIDAVQQANSGHPGAPMGLAPVVYELWQGYLRYDPADPLWPNRDRFVLSAGHASMLLYATLHLAGVRAVNAKGLVTDGFAMPMEELKRFRQIDSRTPGHPESHLTTGVETTTGPLGQGAGNSVGMAIAGKWLAENFNRPGFDIFNFNVYTICGDGDLMEGVACEAASLAGHLKLSNLCWIYDNNRVTLDGPAEWSFSEDVMTRFAGYGWNVTHVTDANDLDMLARAYDNFLKSKDRPTLIVVDSHIGYGSPHKQDSYEAHGEPLGEAEVKLVKKNYGWPENAKFLVPDGVYDQFKNGVGKRGAEARAAWKSKYEEYKKQFPQQADQLNRMQTGQLPDGWEKDLPSFPADQIRGSRGMEIKIRGVQETVSAASRSTEQDADRPIAGRLGKGFAELPRRSEGHGDARILGKNVECPGEEYPLAGWRLGRPGQIQQDQPDVRRRGRFLPQSVSRAQRPLRRAGTCHGRDRERHDAFEAARLQRHVLQFRRLYAAEHAPRRADGNPFDVHFHARLDWRGRRWADAPAHRATGVLARDAQHVGSPAGRCQ